MVFRNNDLPGVMLASAAQRADAALGCGARPAGRGRHRQPEGYAAALDLLDAGIALQAVLDLRSAPPACAARDELLARGVRVRDGWTVVEALPGRAGARLEAAVVDRITGEGRTALDGTAVACDLVVTSVGTAPLGQLACHVGARFAYDEPLATFRVEGHPGGMRLAGSVNQRHSPPCAGARRWPTVRPLRGSDRRKCRSHPWPIFPHATGKDFVDFDEDQTGRRPR